MHMWLYEIKDAVFTLLLDLNDLELREINDRQVGLLKSPSGW